jgi:hypothetical protein
MATNATMAGYKQCDQKIEKNRLICIKEAKTIAKITVYFVFLKTLAQLDFC